MPARSVRRASLPLVVLAFAPALAAPEPLPESSPDPELIEFLGEWTTDDGTYIDPLALEEAIEDEGHDDANYADVGDE